MNATNYQDLDPVQRILLGPGPSTASPRVLRAMSTPLVGHLDPQFLDVMNEVVILALFAVVSLAIGIIASKKRME